MTESDRAVDVKARADQGDVEAQVALGGATYAAGDMSAAAHWYRLAAEQGHCLAQYNLGFLTATGLGVEPDEAEAIQWYLLAAAQGSRDAMNNLGMLYRAKGELPDAAEMFRRAGALGHADALASYSHALDRGLGIPADPAAAIEHYQRAAELGSSWGQY